jgi:hypothetical protein
MIGTTGTVRCYKKILNSVSITNDVGGTSELPVGNYRVKVTKAWGDYEIGGRGIGVLLNEKDIKKSRKAGTTPWKEKKGEFDPSIVYFSLNDFTAD